MTTPRTFFSILVLGGGLAFAGCNGEPLRVPAITTPTTPAFKPAAEDIAPAFPPGRIPDQVWVLGDSITPLTLPEAVGGNGRISYRVQPPLPAGVRLNGRRLSGTPTGTEHWGGTKRPYEWVATDRDGDPASMVFNLGLEGGVLLNDWISTDRYCREGSCTYSAGFQRWRLLDVNVEVYLVEGIYSTEEARDFLGEPLRRLLSRQQPVLYREWREVMDEGLGSLLRLRARGSRRSLDAGEILTQNWADSDFGVSGRVIFFRWNWREAIFVGGETSGTASFSDGMWEHGGLQRIVVSPDTRRYN